MRRSTEEQSSRAVTDAAYIEAVPGREAPARRMNGVLCPASAPGMRGGWGAPRAESVLGGASGKLRRRFCFVALSRLSRARWGCASRAPTRRAGTPPAPRALPRRGVPEATAVGATVCRGGLPWLGWGLHAGRCTEAHQTLFSRERRVASTRS
ncbi:hypothetical protein NDU88_005844 [Pleurodeles waltl]|uniref:Uncharacterized protein n=1 Tax=Pleurodeles waltl TaxID=8319 RepID=A0AAV7UJA7_PLEWA|nr:hypothetical protein NDU88_005844 [Pleurodeles waltl]